MKRNLIILILACIVVISATGCMNREQLKTDFSASLTQHTKMRTYSFSGSAAIHLPATDAPAGISPVSAGLIKLLMNSKLSWEGVASTDPLQLEATLTIRPDAADSSYEIPLLIKDNMMYIHIPTLNSEKQFMAIDFAELSELTGKPDSASAQLGQAGQLFADMAGAFVSALDPKHFASAAQEEGTAAREITATIKPGQEDAAVKLWFQTMPRIIDRMASARYIDEEQAAHLRLAISDERKTYWTEQKDAVTLREPAVLSAQLDAQGFIRRLALKAAATVLDAQQTSKEWELDIVSNYDQINASPAFTSEVPDDILPFTEILKAMTSEP